VVDDHGYDEREVGFEITTDVTEADLRGALDELDWAMSPGEIGVVGQELARLRMLTKAKDEPGVATAYLQELRRYPEWAVIETCRYFAENEKFFPAWSEMHEMLERKVKRFRRMIEKVEAELRRARGFQITARTA